jgi:hypothetical protein
MWKLLCSTVLDYAKTGAALVSEARVKTKTGEVKLVFLLLCQPAAHSCCHVPLLQRRRQLSIKVNQANEAGEKGEGGEIVFRDMSVCCLRSGSSRRGIPVKPPRRRRSMYGTLASRRRRLRRRRRRHS